MTGDTTKPFRYARLHRNIGNSKHGKAIYSDLFYDAGIPLQWYEWDELIARLLSGWKLLYLTNLQKVAHEI